MKAWPETFFGAAADDFAVEGRAVGGEGKVA